MIKPVNIDPAVRASQMIRPSAQGNAMGGAPKTPSSFMSHSSGLKTDASRVNERMHELSDAKRIRGDYLEDQERIRGQKLEDDVTRRNNQIDDLDRTRMEKLGDDERAYTRNEYKRDAEKKRNEIYFKQVQLDRKNFRIKQKEEKEDMLLKTQTAYGKLLDMEKQGASSEEVRSMINEQRLGLDRERKLNKENMVKKIMADVGIIMQAGEDDESMDYINSMVRAKYGESMEWSSLKTDQQKTEIAKQLGFLAANGKLAGFGGIEEKVSLHVNQTSDEQKRLNEAILDYDKLLADARSREISKDSIRGLKEAYRKRIGSLGGSMEMFESGEDESESTEEEESPPVAEKSSLDGYLTEEEEGKMDISQARNNIEDIEKDRSSITGSVIQSISDGASNLSEGIENAGGYGEVAKEGLTTMAENPGATITAGYLAKKGMDGAKSLVASNNSAKKAEKILEMIEADDFYQKYSNDFMTKNGIKPYKDIPVPGTDKTKNLKDWIEWKQGFDKHIDTEVASKTKTFIGRTRKLLDKARGNKLLKTLGLIGVGAEVISIGKDLSQALGFYVPDELKAAQHELYKLQQLQKSNHEKSKALGEMLIEASEDDSNSSTPSTPKVVDTGPPTIGNTIPGLDEANSTTSELQDAMDRMEADGDLAPVPETIQQ